MCRVIAVSNQKGGVGKHGIHVSSRGGICLHFPLKQGYDGYRMGYRS